MEMPVESLTLPGYDQIQNEDQFHAIFLALLEDRSELGSSFRAKLQAIASSKCEQDVDLTSSVRISEKDKIDVTIECPNVVLLIELKWGAKEGAGQTGSYEKVASCFYRDREKVFLFITRDGDEPVSRKWVPIAVVPGSMPSAIKMTTLDTRAILDRHTSRELSKKTGIHKIANLLGPDFPGQLCARAESLTGIPHAVCPEYRISDVHQESPSRPHLGGWYGKAPGRYLRLFEREMAATPEFYVACGDGLRLPFVMSEVLVDGLELRIKYQCFAEPKLNAESQTIRLEKLSLFDAIKHVQTESLLWPPKANNSHHDFHHKQLLSRLEFEALQSQPNQLKEAVLDRAGDFYRELARVYTEAGRGFLSRFAKRER